MTPTQQQPFKLKGGVLIIGSLLWQDYLDKPGNDIRKSWRADHLLTESKIMVKVPIRYGRFSDKDNVFTMTFSKSVSNRRCGTGYFIPFSKSIITSKIELINEALALSRAEGMRGRFVGRPDNWGALGILFNYKKIDGQLKNRLITLWQEKLTKTNEFDNQHYRLNKETPCIKPNGTLNFQWISPVDSRLKDLLDSYDFLIATVTRPTNYPLINELAENVHADKSRHYFIENYKHGITTFQDIAVINKLKQTRIDK
jgi:hypothetical protein